MNYKQKIVQVDEDTFRLFESILGRHNGRCQDKDTSKSLEVTLCKLAFSKSDSEIDFRSASSEDDIRHDVDVLVNGCKVQVKCRRNDHLILEDFKVRKGKKLPGWLDRSQADFFLFAWPSGTTCKIGLRILKGEDLKRLLNIYRLDRNRLEISLEDQEWVKEWGGLQNYVYHPEKVNSETEDGLGSYYETVL